MDVSDVIGHFGPFQLRLVGVLFLRAICAAFILINFQLIAFEPSHWCVEPYEHLPNQTTKEQCSRRTDNRTEACRQWQYGNDTGHESIVEEWDLVCERSWLISFGYMTIVFGNFISYVPAGYLADRFGRLPVTLIGQVFLTITTFAAGFSNSATMLMTLRILQGIAFGFTQNPLVCIFFESVGPAYRDLVVLSFAGMWGLGMMTLSGLAYLIHDWRTLLFVTSLPVQFPMLILVYWLVPESIRWLLVAKRYAKAEVEIVKRAKQNNIVLVNSANAVAQLKKKIETEQARRGRIVDLMANKYLRKYTLILYTAFCLNVFVYHGFMITIEDLDGSLHMNVFLSGAVELPVVVVYFIVVKFFGRRRGLLVSYLFSGLLFLLTLAVPEEMTWLRIFTAMTSRFFNALGYALLYVFAAELFPTELRAVAISGAMFAGRLGGVLSPFTSVLGRNFGRSVPISLYGVLSLITSFILLLLPETVNKNLPDTVYESERLSRKVADLVDKSEVKVFLEVKETRVLNS